MFRKATYKFLSVVLIVTLSVLGVVENASAQGGAAVTAYSPYTMFGIGELQTIGTTPMRSMGGVGVAWRSSQMPSMVNPAGYSATLPKSFIFGFGIEGNFLQNAQRQYDANGAYTTAKNGKNSVNFHEIAVQFPVAKRLGIGVSLMPYSSVGYKMSFLDQKDEIAGNIGAASYTYSGEGDVTEVKLGIGWEPFKNFSIGVAAKYYWGKIDHNYTSAIDNNFVGENSFYSVIGNDEYAISDFKFQVGLQWNILSDEKKMLTLGATYDYGGHLHNKITKSIVLNNTYSTESFYESKDGQMRLPHMARVGLLFHNPKFVASAEYEFQAWGSGNSRFTEQASNGIVVQYVDTHTAKVGFAYTPNRFDVRNYFNRISYRVGYRYGDYYQSYNSARIQQMAVTAGFGFPLKFMGTSSIDVSFEYGLRGAIKKMISTSPQVGMIRQDYFKVGLGFSLFGEDYWFVRPKYD